MKTIKGFGNNLKCRGFQYEIGKTYNQQGVIEACRNGFHAIDENSSPLSVFDYYPPIDENNTPSRYCEVEVGGEIDRLENKVACSQITIGNEIGIPEIVNAHVEWVKKNGLSEKTESNTGDCSAAINNSYRSAAINNSYRSAALNTGDCSAAINNGNRSAAINTGFQSAAINTGNRSAALNTGDCSAATNTGFQSAAINTGNCSAATNTGFQSAAINNGDYSAAINNGNCSTATNTGNRSMASVEGKDSVAVVTGRDSYVKGALGCAIFAVERDDYNKIKSICSAIVDGVKIKADTWYTVKNGKFVEVED